MADDTTQRSRNAPEFGTGTDRLFSDRAKKKESLRLISPYPGCPFQTPLPWCVRLTGNQSNGLVALSPAEPAQMRKTDKRHCPRMSQRRDTNAIGDTQFVGETTICIPLLPLAEPPTPPPPFTQRPHPPRPVARVSGRWRLGREMVMLVGDRYHEIPTGGHRQGTLACNRVVFPPMGRRTASTSNRADHGMLLWL